MGEKKVVFRTSIRGYNKKDVYRYIDEANQDVMKRIAGYESAIRERDLQIAALEREHIAAQTEQSRLLEQISSGESAADALREKIALTEKTAEDAQQQCKEKDMQLQLLSFRIEQMENELSAIRSAYEEMVAQCGELTVMLDGYDTLKRKADGYDKIAERLKAVGLRKETAPAAASAQTSDRSGEKAGNVPSDGGTVEEKTLDAIQIRMRDIQERFAETLRQLERESESMKERLGSILHNTEVAVIREFSRKDVPGSNNE